MIFGLGWTNWLRLIVWMVDRPRVLLQLQPLSQQTHAERSRMKKVVMQNRSWSSQLPNFPASSASPRGKVRDVYSIADKVLGDPLLIVATDRISAFDCILPQGIPGKGRVLTQMSLFWFDFLAMSSPNHLITPTWMSIRRRCTRIAISSKAGPCW